VETSKTSATRPGHRNIPFPSQFENKSKYLVHCSIIKTKDAGIYKYPTKKLNHSIDGEHLWETFHGVIKHEG
jgi:hypothetical protein